MDVKQFFRKRLVAFVAALLSVGFCGLPQAHADQNYQPDVNIGGTITGSKDISDYGVAEENGYIATFKNPNGSLNANIQDWNVTNNATQNTYKEATYDGTFYYDNQGEDGIIWRNAKLVLAAPTDSTSSAPRNVNVTVKGTNQFGSGLNVGDWGNTMGPEYNMLPIKAKEVDVLFGSMNDGNSEDRYDGNTGAYAEVTFATGSNSHFWGGVQFGGQDGANLQPTAGNAKVVFEEGSTVTFENQNTYFGGGGWNADGVINGGDADVTFKGTTTFNQRAVFGGGASVPTGEGRVKVGNSDVVFETGTNYFTGKNATYVDAQGLANQKNYYGVYFSSIGGLDGLAEGGTANVTINSGTNTFDTEVHSVGNYDFTPYGDIIRSKDDFDVTWGGNSNVLVTGGDNKFNGRSTFGAPNGKSTLNFTGGRTQFNGTVRSANMGKGDILDDVPFSEINTNYNGQDIPYVYFGGKSLTDEDVNYWNNYYNLPGHDAFEMSTDDYDHIAPNINVNLSGRTKVVLNTTGFVGGADYKQLDGSVDIEKENNYTSSVYKDFTYGDDGAESPKDHKFTVDYTRFNTNADTADTEIFDYETGKIDQTAEYTHKLLKDDAGSGTFTVGKGAELRMGLYNTTQLYNAPDSYLSPDNIEETVIPQNVGYTTNRSAQVQLIGNTSTFTANETTLNFTIDPNGTQCLNEEGEWVERLNVGRISFQTINIDKNTKLYLSPAYQGTLCNQLIGKDGKDKEFYSIEAFHDTDGTQLNIDPEINNIGGKHLFYNVGVEGLANDDGTPNVPFEDKARLHVTYHDPHSVVADGNLGHNMDNYLHELCYQQEDDYQEALEDIWNSDDKIEAQEKFDDLAGGIYGDWLNAQVQRQIAFNNMLSNRLVTDDMGLCQFCCQSQCAEYSSDCEPGCNQCCARRQCEFGGRICGKYPRYCEPRRSVWGSFTGNYGDGLYWKGFTKYHEESSGMAVGIEWKNVCCRVFGMYFGYSTSDIWHTNGAVGNTYSRIKSDDFSFGLYAKWDANCMGGYWLANGTFTYNTLDGERYYNTQSFDNNFTADTKGLSAAAYIERGWMYVEKHGFVINPYASVQYTFATIDDFTEEGTSNVGGVVSPSNMNLYCYDMAYHSLRGQLGVRVSRDFIVGCNNWQILRLTLGGAFAHEFLDPQATYYTHVMGSRSMDPSSEYGDFEMQSNGCSRNWANLMFSADYRLTQRMSANFQYNTYFNQYKTVNALNATLRIDF